MVLTLCPWHWFCSPSGRQILNSWRVAWPQVTGQGLSGDQVDHSASTEKLCVAYGYCWKGSQSFQMASLYQIQITSKIYRNSSLYYIGGILKSLFWVCSILINLYKEKSKILPVLHSPAVVIHSNCPESEHKQVFSRMPSNNPWQMA